ncbi:MAG: M20/M25/M40 family metallo-hydrolase, partial [Glutamicibacter arilaitensis]
GTEAGLFAAAGIPTVVCGPGDIAQAHAPDEYIELEQIVACENFIDSLIAQLSS